VLMSRQDNIQNIISLINSQMESMNSYSLTISRMMGNINNSVHELIRLQEYVEMEHSLDRYYNNQGRYTRPSGRLSSNFSPIGSGSSNVGSNVGSNVDIYPTRPATRRTVRNSSQRQTSANRTTMPSLFSNSRLRTTSTNPLFNRRPLVQPIRRMSLQEFINTTLNQGNVTIPADNNQIMQETSMVDFEDLLETDNTSCPISLVAFDSSSNILRINRCGHVFDATYLRRWFRQDSRCPVCRYNINTATSENTTNNENLDDDNSREATDTSVDEIPPPNTVVYDISFSIPQLFGRDMSENQINSVINSITDAITSTINSSGVHSGSIDLGNNIHAVVESVSLQNNSDVNNVSSTLASSWSDMTDDSDDEEI
jgi:hypothetical protein